MQAHIDYCPTIDPNDLLSEVLQDLRLARASYGRSELTAPWGIEIPYKAIAGCPKFFAVLLTRSLSPGLVPADAVS